MAETAGSYSQCSGELARAWAERPAVMTSIPAVARLSGGSYALEITAWACLAPLAAAFVLVFRLPMQPREEQAHEGVTVGSGVRAGRARS